MGADAIKHQLQSLGIDDALIKDIMSAVKPDPLTGKIGIDSIMKYIMESKNPQLKRALQNGAKLIELQRKENSVDWSTVDFNALPVQENVTWWLRLTTLTDGGTSTQPARHLLECMTYGNKIDSPRMVDKYKNPPTSEELLHFIKRCMARPLPGLEPAIPNILIVQRNLKQHTISIKPFLDSLPTAFKWAVESQIFDNTTNLTSSASPRFSASIFSYDVPIHMAQQAKAKGNAAHAKGDRAAAINAYSDAIERLMNAFRSDPNRDKNKEAEKLLAVCCANRAAAHLMPGDDMDPHEAWKDGEVAMRADPSYSKGYIRVSRAHQELGNLKKAKESIARGLRRVDLQNDAGLVDKLIELQTNGKGLPMNGEEFLAWRELVLVEDEDSAKMMENVHGLWRRRLDEHMREIEEQIQQTKEEHGGGV